MTNEAQRPATACELQAITAAIQELTDAIREQNQLLKDVVIYPAEGKPRLAVGTVGAVEFIEV